MVRYRRGIARVAAGRSRSLRGVLAVNNQEEPRPDLRLPDTINDYRVRLGVIDAQIVEETAKLCCGWELGFGNVDTPAIFETLALLFASRSKLLLSLGELQ